MPRYIINLGHENIISHCSKLCAFSKWGFVYRDGADEIFCTPHYLMSSEAWQRLDKLFYLWKCVCQARSTLSLTQFSNILLTLVMFIGGTNFFVRLPFFCSKHRFQPDFGERSPKAGIFETSNRQPLKLFRTLFSLPKIMSSSIGGIAYFNLSVLRISHPRFLQFFSITFIFGFKSFDLDFWKLFKNRSKVMRPIKADQIQSRQLQ